jgi:hypothetical protein
MRHRRRALRRRYGRASAADRTRLAERRKLSPYNAKVHDEQRFGTVAREELKAMFFSGGNVGVGVPRTISASEAGDMAAAFYRKHIAEFDQLYHQGYTGTDAARALGSKHGVRYFR